MRWPLHSIGPALLTLYICLSGCDPAENQRVDADRRFAGEHPIRCLATTGMVADIVRQVGGELVEVDQLMGEGVDPHLYKASTGDVNRLKHADIIFYSGLHLEGKLSELLEHMSRKRPVFAVTDKIAQDKLLTVAGGAYDPHVWFDVALWQAAAQRVIELLSAFDPANAETYQSHGQQYTAELTELDAYVRRRIQEIPDSRRVLVTAHDAFHYFGRAYGLELRPIQGISTESEASVRTINDLVRFLADRSIGAVFVETSVNERNVLALVEGCRALGHEIQIGGELYSDAMGRPGTPAGTYSGMVRHNVDVIVEALK